MQEKQNVEEDIYSNVFVCVFVNIHIYVYTYLCNTHIHVCISAYAQGQQMQEKDTHENGRTCTTEVREKYLFRVSDNGQN